MFLSSKFTGSLVRDVTFIMQIGRAEYENAESLLLALTNFSVADIVLRSQSRADHRGVL